MRGLQNFHSFLTNASNAEYMKCDVFWFRQPPSPLFALGLLSFVIASSVLLIYRAEERSRSRLGKIGEEVEEVAPPQPISLDAEETYSRYKAAISQNRFIEGAIAAIQKQDLMRLLPCFLHFLQKRE